MAKLIIDNNVLAEEFFADARTIGIQCPLSMQHFMWMINKRFSYNFRYQTDSEIEVKKKERTISLKFPIFECNETNLELWHIIYANQYEGEYLLPELKHYDFIWILKGEHENILLPLINEIKTIEQVLVATEIANEKIINKKQLVL